MWIAVTSQCRQTASSRPHYFWGNFSSRSWGSSHHAPGPLGTMAK